MRNCPNCKELIGDELTSCPICKTVFTAEEMEALRREAREKEIEAKNRETSRLISYRKKRTIMTWMMLGGVFTLLFSPLLIVNKVVGIILIVLFVVLFFGGIIFGLVSGAACCPHCKAILFRNHGDYCQSCGKQIW